MLLIALDKRPNLLSFYNYSKRFTDDTRQEIFLGYVLHTDCLFTWYDERIHQVKVVTHAKFDKGFSDLPIDNITPNYQYILCLNGQPIPINDKAINISDLEFFIYPFTKTETADIVINPKTKNNFFSFKLIDNNFTGRNYVKEVKVTVGSSAAGVFGISQSFQ